MVDAANLQKVVTASIKAADRAMAGRLNIVTEGEQTQLEKMYAKIAQALKNSELTNEETKEIVDFADGISPKATGHICTGKGSRTK